MLPTHHRARETRRIAVATDTPNRTPAVRAAIPSLAAFKTRDRKSALNVRAIKSLHTGNLETDKLPIVTSKSVQRSKDTL